ncbi:Bug family tripartite tricarboxylate transporter substrate binding protein [Modicisalibacter luteus]|uniref:Bug family tripartite tricarboxylate transporter substrate binding protein n=1 Tax=Modicisalibacter luteus TaxID=453962 RepID=A0ABV7LZP3_9GAMM|nr:tripartite tricarboxylate transporter substrate-binding protein [Halomonas lutea]GHA95839.1 C4-dicarboxylate ABC transporter substrate-binding protein [Halomonas lutea]
MQRTLRSLALASLPLLTALSASAFAVPEGKTECIAPAKPGGGWDFTCRSVARTLQELDLIPAGMQTINIAGASGGVAFSHVLAKRQGDEDTIVAASTATTTRLAQRRYAQGSADQVRWAAALGADYGIIAVAEDAPYATFTELLDALAQDPGSVSFSGGDVAGGFDHLKVLMSAREAGIEKLRDIKYLAFDSGSVAITQLLGGHIDAFTGDLSEALGFVESGDLRLLAVFSEERLPGEFSDIPTAREQGIDVIAPNWRGFYLPGGVSDASYQWWVDKFETLYASEEWKDVMQQNGLLPFHKSGDAMTQFVDQQVQDIRELSDTLGLVK